MFRAILIAAALGCPGIDSARAAEPWVGQGTVTWTRMTGISVQSPQMLVKISRDIGERVKKGDILVQCDDKMAKIGLNMTKLVLKKAELEVKNAETKVVAAKASLQAQRNKADLDRAETDVALASGQLEIAKVELEIQKELVADAERKVDTLILRAPFDGMVSARFSEAGDMVTGAGPILNIVGGSTVIEADVPDRLVKLVAAKHPVEVTTLREFGGETYHGEISRMSNIIDPQSRAFKIQVTLPESAQKSLRFGMVVNLKIVGKEEKDKEKKEKE